MEWESYFQKRILDRGYDYYFDDRVEDLRITPNRIKAVVHGTDFYHVEIKLKGNQIIGMSCDCPYAQDDHNCKHMAAVLYEWQLSATHPVINNSKLVKEASEEDVQSFLIQVLNDNPDLVETFKQYAQNEFSLDTMIDDLEGVCDSYSDGYHYIDYEFSTDFCDNYEDAVFKWLDLLKEKKQYSLAFRFLLKAYDIFDKLDIEDNEGETVELSFSIINACSSTIMCMEESERIDAFNSLKQFLNNTRDYYARVDILQVFFNHLKGEDLLKLQIDFVKEQLDYIDSHNDILDREYVLDGFSKMYLELLKKNNASKKEINAIYKKYWKCGSIRMDCVYTCINNEEYDKALDYIDKCIDLDYENQALMKRNIELKKDIYKKQGNTKAYREELKNLILFFNDTDIEDYIELRSCYLDKEWIEERDSIIQQLTPGRFLCEVLETEQLYEQLLDVILRSDDKYLLHQYTDMLSDKYPEQLLKVYRERVEKQAESTGSRKHYYQIVEELRIMKSITGGDKVVDEIIKKWKIQYKNRSAMLDELSQL
ncbi:SWIM zinc finger family protein [uncultured Catenibacterium sp.]|uniref:SWIM zinc finger family protein n=1 Tax=uncultured Catenibacterium sp. TaxID=286142 RepID=UPI002602493A|nr:SWIM zinc finger family protein [uncultured Catenibacterium sp.]